MDPRIHAAIERMRRDYARPLTIDTLAREANLSRSRFAQLFRSSVNCGPIQYLRRVRLERARAILLGTQMAVREVMVAVGFQDPSHFTRDFRLYHGESPRDLRRRSVNSR